MSRLTGFAGVLLPACILLLAGLVAVLLIVWDADGSHAPQRAGGVPSRTSKGLRVARATTTLPTITTTSLRRETKSTAVLRSGSVASFQQFQRTLAGHVGISIAPIDGNRVITLGDDTPAHGWSTTKVPVLVALIERLDGRSHLSTNEQNEAEAAITQSDNQSILDLFADLESLTGGLVPASVAIQNLFRESGDHTTVVTTGPPPAGAVTTFGQTRWSPSKAVLFYRHLAAGCLMRPTDTNYVLKLMQHIIWSERWGLGSAGFGPTVAFKGGWGPEPTGAYLVRQSGVIDPGTRRAVAVAIVERPPVGADSFTVGTEMLTATAQWLRRHILLTVRRAQSDCA